MGSAARASHKPSSRHGIIETTFGLDSVKNFRSHTNWVWSIVEVADGVYVSSSDDHTFKVWDETSGYCQRTLPAPECWIYSIETDGRQLFHCGPATNPGNHRSDERYHVQTTDITSGKSSWATAMAQDIAHLKPITSLNRRSSILITGSLDHTAKVWDLGDGKGECVQTLKEHEKEVYCAIAEGANGCLTGSDDKTVKHWDTRSGLCTVTFSGHKGRVRCVQYIGDKVVSSGEDCSVKVWDMRKGECLYTEHSHSDGGRDGHEQRVYCMARYADLFATGSADRKVKIWQLTAASRLRLVQVLSGRHFNSVLSVLMNGRRVVTSSADHESKVWLARNPLDDSMLRPSGADSENVPELKVAAAEGTAVEPDTEELQLSAKKA